MHVFILCYVVLLFTTILYMSLPIHFVYLVYSSRVVNIVVVLLFIVNSIHESFLFAWYSSCVLNIGNTFIS